jgi:hypothetical protein
LENIGIDGRIVLKQILKLWVVGLDWIDFAQDRDMSGCCECGNELPGSIKFGEFLD